jgi:Domain of Unknown Function (DUF1206)
MSTTHINKGVKARVRRAGRKAEYSPVMEIMTRLGYGVRGFVYVMMGLLSLGVALGIGGALASPQAAIAAIGKQPAGLILLWVVLVGIISYAAWGLVRAVMDPLDNGRDLKGLLARFGFLNSAFGYAILALSTFGYITGASQKTAGSQNHSFTASIMALPGGRWALGILGAAVLAGGLYQIYLGFSKDFNEQFKSYVLTSKEVKLTTSVGRFGTSARGIVFALVGALIVLAAFRANPSQPVGMDTALATLIHQPFGMWVLGIVAVGLISFGLYSMLGALWFRIKK